MKKCFSCGKDTGTEMYGTPACERCISDLRLFTKETIQRHIAEYSGSKKYATYEDEISDRLRILELDYKKKRIKLLHVLGQLKEIST